MRPARIKQLDKLIRGLRADGYPVKLFIRIIRDRLVISVDLTAEDVEELTAQRDDLRKVEG